METLWIIVQMMVIIIGLVAIVGTILYAFCWTVLLVVAYFPVIGKRHRHKDWTELNKPRQRP